MPYVPVVIVLFNPVISVEQNT